MVEGGTAADYVLTDQATLYVETAGRPENPAVILCQGLGMRIADWPEALVSRLSRNFHVLMLDNRDAGKSSRCTAPYTLFDMASDVVAAADHFDLPRFSLVGFSMGGMICQIIGAKHPERVSTLVQICSSSGEAVPPFPDTARARLEKTAAGFAIDTTTVDWLAEDIAYFAAPQIIPKDDAQKRAKEAVEAGHSADAFARQYQAINGSGDRSKLLQDISAETLIIAGAKDCCIPQSSSVRAANLIPNAQLRCFQGMGHTITDNCIEATIAWMNGYCAVACEKTT